MKERDPLELGPPPEAYMFRWAGALILLGWAFLLTAPFIQFANDPGFYVEGFMYGIAIFLCFVRSPEGARMGFPSMIAIRLLAFLVPTLSLLYATILLQTDVLDEEPTEYTKMFLELSSQYLDAQALIVAAYVASGISLAILMFLLPAMKARNIRHRRSS
jgi:hypothetical protein